MSESQTTQVFENIEAFEGHFFEQLANLAEKHNKALIKLQEKNTRGLRKILEKKREVLVNFNPSTSPTKENVDKVISDAFDLYGYVEE